MSLNWIGRSGSEHPMADAAQARQIVGGLPAADPVRALEEVGEWLESLNETDGLTPDRLFESIELLDGAARTHQRKVAQEYLSTPRVQKFLENRLWNAGFGFWKQLADAYLLCIRQAEAGFTGAASVRRNLPVLMARAARALAAQLKWVLLRYGLAEDRLWGELARLYHVAERKGIADSLVPIHPGKPGASTVGREFAKALMLSASSTDGLPPVSQEIAERLVSQWAESFRVSAQPEGCTHCFDLAEPKAPVRLYQGATPSESLRFFGAGDALATLEQAAERIGKSGELSRDLDLGGSYHPDIVAGVLRHLRQCWSDQPPARNAERRLTAGRITVVPGREEIVGVLDPSVTNDLDFSGHMSAESWIVENASEGGYGAIIPAQKVDWVRVGALIGVKTETSNYLGIGLIRRITRDAYQQRRVGIQLLTRAAVPVRVSRSATTSMLDFNIRFDTAILLSTAPDGDGEIGLVLRGGTYNGRDRLDMMVRAQTYLLTPSRLVEAGEDFDWAKFKIMQRSA